MEDLKNQIINKAGFLIYTDYWEKYFSKMTGDQVKEVFKIIFHFNTTFEILKTNDLAIEMVVSTIIDSIKRDAIKRCKQSIASARNGKLGGRPKVNNKIKKTKLIKEKNIEEEKFKPIANVIEETYLFLKLPSFIDKKLWQVFVDFRISIATSKKPFTDNAKELIIERLTEFENKKTGFANQSLKNSIENSWQGVFEPKQQNQTNENQSINYFTKFANNLNKGGSNE